MRIYVKRENWDGGLWLALPASDADAKKLMGELAQIHPSVMLPFVGEVDSGIKGLGERLVGELVFEKGHLAMFNRLARCTDGMEAEDMLLFSAAVEMEKPESIEQVLKTMGHMDRYELRPDIRDLDGLGRYAVRKEGKEIPKEIQGNFDYGLYASTRWQRYGCFTEGSFVERRLPEKEQPGGETGGAPGRRRGMEAVFTMEVKKQPYGYESFSLPMPERELAEAERKIGTAGAGHDAQMRVLVVYDGLFETLPPGSSIRELNQAAAEIRALMEKAEPDWNLLLAALEAELPETMEDACRIIRNCADYEFLPLETLEPEDYARYILKKEKIGIPPGLQSCIKYREFGQKKLEEAPPVETFYGIVVNKKRTIGTAPGKSQNFRLFSPLKGILYPYDEDWGGTSDQAEEVSAGELCQYEDKILERIGQERLEEGERGFAVYLGNRLLKRKGFSMAPTVEMWAGAGIRWFGERFEQRENKTEEGDLCVRFWHSGDDFFIKTEQDLKQWQTQDFGMQVPINWYNTDF